MSHVVRSVARISLSTALFSAPLFAQSVQDITGLTALQDRVGAATPTGATVPVGQVEANAGTGWAPDTTNPEFVGKTFTMKSAAPGVSGHATYVGQRWYGTASSLAPAISSIDCYNASAWLANGWLHGGGSTPPNIVALRIFNNSWIGSGTNPELRKLDYAVNTQGLIFCNGVNNGQGPLDVTLLSHMFNGMAVGRSDGQHHSGDTGLGVDGPGRMKPEIVAPEGATSFSTPLVSGGAALMLDTANTNPLLALDPNAVRPEVVRAVLMAGAQHRAGWSNGAVASGPTRGTTTTPLDALYGADQLEVNHAHWILTGLEQLPAPTAAQTTNAAHAGWALADIASGSSVWWRFSVESTKPHVSILAAWNRDVAADFQSWSMPNIDLELWRIDPVNGQTTLVGDPGLPYFSSGNVQSTSPDDNVEHLYLTDLAQGDYLLEMRRSVDSYATWQVAVAWEFAAQSAVQYCVGKTNSLGLVADLSAHGFPNVSANQFELRVKNAVPNKFGLVFWGTSQANLAFMGGTLCVHPPITRLPVVALDSNGSVSIPIALDSSMVGTTRDWQFWYRDPNDPTGFSIGLSNAVEVLYAY